MIISKNVRQSIIQIFVISVCLLNLFKVVNSECGGSEWDCDNGDCIADIQQCDGVVHCRDGSDEIAENCIHVHESCQTFAFHCTYGACVDGNKKCDGVQDCFDNSDELICNEKRDADFQGTCNEDQMQCFKSKECISSTQICDGIAQCRDQTDESPEVCVHYRCQSYGFQCGYGACIIESAKCNGINECLDGSDEAWELCGTPRKTNNLTYVITTPKTVQVSTRPTPVTKPVSIPTTPTTPSFQTNNCFIPNKASLQILKFKLHPQNQTIKLESYVENFETVHIECKNQYTLRGQQSLLCENGKWNNEFPACDGFCDGKILSTLSLRTNCDFNNTFGQCPKKIAPGTLILVQCAYGYTRKPNIPQNIKCLQSGSFDKLPDHCEMSCGKVAPALTALSKDGFEIDASKAPWHVAIYENNSVVYNYICGGSIVSPTVVISAAHCFWDEPNQILKNNMDYQIIAGRSTSNYSTEQNDFSQIIKVRQVYTPKEYRGKDGQQKDDIAFLKLTTPLKFSITIAPICVPMDLTSTASTYMPTGRYGLINGYGSSNHLERLNMITLDYHNCAEKSPPDAPIANDKFCVYSTDGSFVCRGDSGGGFYLKYKDPDTYDITYKLWGVISNTPTTKNDCTRTGDKAYVAITNIFNSRSEFANQLATARIEDEALF